MRAAYIAAGAGGMICGSCLHDNALAGALQRMGHDVALIPTYTPIRTDEIDVSLDRVFYGAINVYLDQKVPLFRMTPKVVGRVLSRPKLLGLISNLESSIDPRQLGDLTLSMLEGEQGRQRKELEELVDWLRDDFRPEIVQITNSMLIGVARRIKAELGVPVLCSVQGEDIFLEQLEEPYHTRVRETLRERAHDVDAFVATSGYYGKFMADYLGVPPERMHVVRLGINLDGHGGDRPVEHASAPFTVGYLARVCPEKGLHVLVEAFAKLADAVGHTRARLKVAGWLGQRDRSYLDECMKRAAALGVGALVSYEGEVDRHGKIEFLHSLDVLSVPTVYKEPKGLYVLEALANGVPVVQPRHGAFPELIESTGGGILVESESPDSLAAGLRRLMEDPEKRAALGRRGKDAVHRDYSDRRMAEATLDLYRRYTTSP